MKKTSALFLLTAIFLLLAACGGENAPVNTTDAAVPTEMENTNTEDFGVESTATPAECTAQSTQIGDLAYENDFITGKTEDYAVTMVVYNDFACEGCAAMETTLATALELYPDDIRLVYRYFPILGGENENGVVAAKAAESAGLQGKFWEMHDLLFSTQTEWVDLDTETFVEFLLTQAADLELDMDQFNQDLNSEAVNEKIADNYNEAQYYAAEPPVVLVNGTTTPIYLSTVADFYLWLETLMIPYGRHLADQQFSECPPMTVDPEKDYTATLHTDVGDIVIALYPDVAPMAVNSFIFLAENGYYDHTPFYAVINGYVVQAGDPSGTGWGSPGYLFGLETSPELSFERPYMVAMANGGVNANNSQFFITLNPLTYLNGQFTIFGEVLDGIEVINSLTERDPESNLLVPFYNYLVDITIEER